MSLALRDIPSIPEKTRRRIQEIAQRLGYSPDPMLSALATYRTVRTTPSYKGVLVWLAESTEQHRWRESPHLYQYYLGAKRRAEERGYSMEVIDIGEMKTTWNRAAGIALARGVAGILVSPLPRADTHIDRFPWKKFAAVTFGYCLTSPWLHAVTAAHYRASAWLVRDLYARGYRRIGAAFRPVLDGRLDHNLTAGYLTGCRTVGIEPLPLCPDDLYETDGSVLRSWVVEYRPEVLLTSNCVFRDHEARLAGGPISPGVAIVCPTLAAAEGTVPGIVEQNLVIGEVVLDLLVNAIHRGELGSSRAQQRVLVDGVFYEGSGLRPRETSAVETKQAGR